MTDQIHLSSPDVTELEEVALVRAIRSGWVAPLGPEVDAFERELAEFGGREHAVALSSGTAALHLGLLTLGVGPGDVVVTSSFTFVATANAISYTGAEPVFVDADETGNINTGLLEESVSTLEKEGRNVRAILPVDMFGKVVAHERIEAVAGPRSIPVLSDAAESLGAIRNGRSSGSYGTAAVLSFNGNKVMTTSGGGALLTDDQDFAQHVRYLATQAGQPVPYYEHTDIGYNYRLSNLLAALGRAQLSRVEEMIERRRQIRLMYREFLNNVPGVKLFGEPSGIDGGPTRDNFWLTSIMVDPEVAGFTAEELRLHLASQRIESRPLWKPMHLQPIYEYARAFVDGKSEHLFRNGLALPSSSALNESELSTILNTIASFLDSKEFSDRSSSGMEAGWPTANAPTRRCS